MPAQAPTSNPTLDQILKALREGMSFCLSGHQNPDADVVGSELAMASLIDRLGPGKKIDIANAGHPPKSLSFLPGFNTVKSVDKVDGTYDVAIVFECSGQDRMGNVIDLAKQAKTVINLDHHLHNPNFGTINLVEPTTSSTAELIFKIIEHSKLPITKAEATCLWAGLTADTGWFRYGNTNTQSMEIAGKLLATGLPISDIAEKMYMSRTHAAIKLLGWVLSNMRLFHQDRVAMLTIPIEIYEKLGAGPDDVEEIVNHGLKIDSVLVSVLIKEKSPDLVKASLRSKGNIDINRVARQFGGGGHKNASGMAYNGTMEDAERKILAEVLNVL